MFFGFPAYLYAEENVCVLFFCLLFQPSASMTLKKKKKKEAQAELV